MSAVPPVNHCDDSGPEQIVPPAQFPARLCHTTGVIPAASMRIESLVIEKRELPNGLIVIFLFEIYLKGVFFLASDTCDDRPERVDGQRTAGKLFIKPVVDTDEFKKLLTTKTSALSIEIMIGRLNFMRGPLLKFQLCGVRPEVQELIR